MSFEYEQNSSSFSKVIRQTSSWPSHYTATAHHFSNARNNGGSYDQKVSKWEKNLLGHYFSKMDVEPDTFANGTSKYSTDVFDVEEAKIQFAPPIQSFVELENWKIISKSAASWQNCTELLAVRMKIRRPCHSLQKYGMIRRDRKKGLGGKKVRDLSYQKAHIYSIHLIFFSVDWNFRGGDMIHLKLHFFYVSPFFFFIFFPSIHPRKYLILIFSSDKKFLILLGRRIWEN